LAREGEELVAHRFTTGAMGLTSPAEHWPAVNSEKKNFWSAIKAAILPPAPPEVPAVCIPPGARLRMTGIPGCLQRELDVGSDEIVTFTQTSFLPDAYHDAVRFRNGRQVLLQVLQEGQRVRVLSLGSEDEEEDVRYLRRIRVRA
jgi:hypothetical protein